MTITRQDLITELTRLVDDYYNDCAEMKGEDLPLQFDSIDEAVRHFIKTCHDEIVS